MQQLSLFTEEYQPRFQAYLNHMNATHADEVNTRDFIVWISGLADEFKTMHGIETLQGRHREFDDYVREQVGR